VIDFRYHVVSIVAVFLALALGLFIGGTTLRGPVGADISSRTDTVAKHNGELRAKNQDLRNQLHQRDTFDQALEPYALADRLPGEAVAVVSAPGADSAVRANLETALADAGATVSADVRLKPALLDPQQSQFLGTLAHKVSLPGHSTPAGQTGAQRALDLLAAALGVRASGQTPPLAAVDRLLSTYSAGNLLSVSGGAPRPGTLVVLIVPAPSTSTDQSALSAQAQADQLLAEFAVELDTASDGAVVAGPTSPITDAGVIDAVHSQPAARAEVSTVDDADLPGGAMAAVFALVEQTNGAAGSYGSGTPLPPASPSPTPTP